jgi:hypothetical protein
MLTAGDGIQRRSSSVWLQRRVELGGTRSGQATGRGKRGVGILQGGEGFNWERAIQPYERSRTGDSDRSGELSAAKRGREFGVGRREKKRSREGVGERRIDLRRG